MFPYTYQRLNIDLGRSRPEGEVLTMNKFTAIRVASAAICALVLAAASPVSATVLDLTTAGASGVIGSAFFIQVPDQTTGAGVIEPFLRVQAQGVEEGVNSDGPYTMDEKSGAWTHKVHVSDFGVTDLNGTPSIRFLLDIGQDGSSPLLSLDRLKIYVSPTATYNTLSLLNDHATKLYDMDAGLGDSWIKLNASLNPGNGGGDMYAYLPYSLFAAHSGEYLYLYSKFGAQSGAEAASLLDGPVLCDDISYSSNDGPEEWARVDAGGTPPGEVPEPATLLLLGGGLLGGALTRRRRKA